MFYFYIPQECWFKTVDVMKKKKRLSSFSVLDYELMEQTTYLVMYEMSFNVLFPLGFSCISILVSVCTRP